MHKNTHGMRTGDGIAVMERKDDNGGGDQSADLKESIDAVMTGFEEFKSTNDARMVEIEKRVQPILS